MQNLKDRVAWALKILKKDPALDEDIRDIDLAKKLRISENTLAKYRKGTGTLKGIVVEMLVSLYDFSPAWLLKNEGESFPGAKTKYPEVCAQEEAKESPYPQKDYISDNNMVYSAGPNISAVEGIDVKTFRYILTVINDLYEPGNEWEADINYTIALILQKIYLLPIDKNDLISFLKALHECGKAYKGKGLLAAIDYVKLLSWGRKRD